MKMGKIGEKEMVTATFISEILTSLNTCCLIFENISFSYVSE